MKFALALTACTILLSTRSALAEPAGWESDFGDEVVALTGNDDVETSVALAFDFPFSGTAYRTVFITNNGAIQLGTLGDDNNISLGLWSDLTTFYDDGGYPVISAFNADLDLGTTGTIHFKDFGDRAVFTWNEVGTNEEEEHLLTFQIQIFADGRIRCSYNGILDGPGEDLIDSLDEGILVGISGSTGTDPGVVDLSVPTSTMTDTIYEVWNHTNDPDNSLFDLDQKTIVFTPKAGGGFISEILQPGTVTARPDLLIGKSAGRLKGDGVRDPRQASVRQTIEYPRAFFKTNSSTAHLLLQNDGAAAGNLRLRSTGDRFPRMKVTARLSTGGNVAAAIQAGRFSTNVAAGGSVKVVYRLRTDRYYAGILRGGDRDDTVGFQLLGGGLTDHAAMTNRYR